MIFFLITIIFTQAFAQEAPASEGTLWDFLEPIEELEVEIASNVKVRVVRSTVKGLVSKTEPSKNK